jgi:membrane protein DedA with SNARE-associated domain
VEQFLESWGYLGVFLGILGTGVGFPMPEELPIVVGGMLAGGGSVIWWLMLPVCIVGVVIGDGLLYGIGRLWGRHLLEINWVKTRLLSPERRQHIEQNFHEHGIKILLFARLTPGIRAPIFLTAGITRLPLAKFLFADAIYAVPGVSILFGLGYVFGDRMVKLIKTDAEQIKSITILVVLLGVACYILYRFLRRPVVTGGPEEMPKLVEQVTHSIGQVTHGIEQVTTKVTHGIGEVTTKIIHPKKNQPEGGSEGEASPCPPDGDTTRAAEEGKSNHDGAVAQPTPREEEKKQA